MSSQTGKRYRLPTEAEWEYAARAGSTTQYHFGNSESQLCRYANHADITSADVLFIWNDTCSDGVGDQTAEVGRYVPNAFGLYDMHGNVWEWVQDCWHDSYLGASSDGSARTAGSGCEYHVFRSGAWDGIPLSVRSVTRFWYDRTLRTSTLGFRLVRNL